MVKKILVVLLLISISLNIYFYRNNLSFNEFKRNHTLENSPQLQNQGFEIKKGIAKSNSGNSILNINSNENSENPYQHINDMLEKDYSMYKIDELKSLAESGDLVAYHHLIIEMANDEEINLAYIKKVAVDIYLQGSEAGGFLLLADFSSSVLNDNTEAYSYFLVAEYYGYKLAAAMADDYMYRYNLTKEQVYEASAKAQQLIAKVEVLKNS